jgi:hypothetical protein
VEQLSGTGLERDATISLFSLWLDSRLHSHRISIERWSDGVEDRGADDQVVSSGRMPRAIVPSVWAEIDDPCERDLSLFSPQELLPLWKLSL